MTTQGADELLEKLSRGEIAVAEELHVAYEAYLRAVVRRRMADCLRAAFDSADVVQSVWAHVIRRLASSGWRVASEPQLRALLAVIARRRVASRARSIAGAGLERVHDRDALEAIPACGQPRPSEAAQAADLWERILAQCPAEHREILELRREGVPLVEVAARTGFHEGSVRRILRQLARNLALQIEPIGAHSSSRTGESR